MTELGPLPFPAVDVARVLDLHAAALAHAGGKDGVRDPGLIESAVHGAINAALYTAETCEPDPLHVAAHLLCYLARNHAFIDGNKRVAWLTCEEQLRLVGLRIEATTDDAERLVLDIVERRAEPQQVILWLSEHLSAWSL